MIVGIGIDVVQVSRIERAINRFGQGFLNRVFSPSEIAWCKRRRDPYPCLAARFSAKEAFVKALGTGFVGGISFRHIWVDQLESGAPILTISQKARQLTEDIGRVRIHVSLTHEKEMAAAVVVIEREAAG